MIVIRRATREDRTAVHNITRISFLTYSRHLPQKAGAVREDPEDLETDFQIQEIFLALNDSMPVGTIRLLELNRGAFRFSRLGVLPAYRYMGIGQQLIRTAENRARSEGGREMSLITARCIPKLILFYRHRGYRIQRILSRQDYSRVLMHKNLHDCHPAQPIGHPHHHAAGT